MKQKVKRNSTKKNWIRNVKTLSLTSLSVKGPLCTPFLVRIKLEKA